MNVWQRHAIQASHELVREAVDELEAEVKTLRNENSNLKSDLEARELRIADLEAQK